MVDFWGRINLSRELDLIDRCMNFVFHVDWNFSGGKMSIAKCEIRQSR